MKKLYITILAGIIVASCGTKDQSADAFGNFEADEVIISAQGNGELMTYEVVEGSHYKAGQNLGWIDTIMLSLQKAQVEAQIAAMGTQVVSVHEQIAVYKAQKDKLLIDKARLEKLFENEAATQKQLDDVNSALDVNEKQLVAAKRKINDSNRAVMAQYEPLSRQIDILNEQIKKSQIVAPSAGVVLAKYGELGELMAVGKPVCKMANLADIKLKAYISGDQLAEVKLGQKVTVQSDAGNGELMQAEGEIVWISDKAEFTPKIIQTRDERVALVYAVKVLVDNTNGNYKIGMPGELIFSSNQE